jgi:ubiquinone/menaquinone biosynthesis C-methylase UbiE
MQTLSRFLRFFFHQLYHGFAWSYDFVAAAVSIGRWQGWIETALPYLYGPRVLELGHGPGHLQVAMGAKHRLVFGLDASPQMGQLAQARLGRQALPAQLVTGYAQSLPFRAGCFDNAVATFPTEYIFDPQTLAEVLRILRPRGRLVVIPSAWIGGAHPTDRAAAWLFRITGQAAPLSAENQDRLRRPFQSAGFETRIELVEKHASTVLVLLATKPG